MKKRYLNVILILVLFTGILSACGYESPISAELPAQMQEPLSDAAAANHLPAAAQTWQDGYAKLLRESTDQEFFLCDIDGDEIPELLVGGPVVEAGKYAEYNVYTCKDIIVEGLGTVLTLSFSSLWLDNDNGILGYSYGAGAGGTHRYYIADGVLHYDDLIYGYFYDGEGNCTEWFRGPEGEEVIVTKETEHAYERIWQSKMELESYSLTEENIQSVIYAGQ